MIGPRDCGHLALSIAKPIAAALTPTILAILSSWLVTSARRVVRQLLDRLNAPRSIKDLTPTRSALTARPASTA